MGGTPRSPEYRISPRITYPILGLLCVINLLTLTHIIANTLSGTAIYSLDFVQIQLIGRAIRDNIDPYTDYPTLALRYLGFADSSRLPHPSPYPPTAFAFAILLSYLPLKACSIIWCLSSVGSLWIGLRALIRSVFNVQPSTAWSLLIFNLLLISNAAHNNLIWGNLSIFLFTLVAISAGQLEQKNEAGAGLALGVACALKLFSPVLIFFLLLRKFTKAFALASLVLLTFLISAILLTNLTVVRSYFADNAPGVMSYYSAHLPNYSLWTFWPKLLNPISVDWVPALNQFSQIPGNIIGLFWLMTATSLLFLLAIGYRLFTATSYHSALSVAVTGSLALNPVLWDHYLVLLTIPLAIQLSKSPSVSALNGRQAIVILILGTMILFSPCGLLLDGIQFYGGGEWHGEIPRLARIFSTFPTLGLVIATLLV